MKSEAEDASVPDSGLLSAGMLQQKAATGALWTVLHVAISVPLAFVVNVVVAQALGVADYGELAVLVIAVNVLTAATNLGVSDGVISWGAGAYAKGDVGMARALLRKSLGYHVLVQLPVVCIGVAVIARHQSPIVIACLVVSVALPAVLGSAALTLTVENRSAGGAKVAIASNLATQAVIALTALLSQSAGAVWAARSLLPSMLLPLNFVPLTRDGRHNALRVARPIGFPAGFWRFSLLSATGGLLGLLVFQRSEVVVLRGYDLLTAAGLFALAAGVAAQITAPVDALLGPLRPAVAGVVEAHPDRAPAALLRITRVGGLFSGVLAATAVPLLTGLIPYVYGSEFQGAASVFLLLGLTSCLQSVLGPLTTFTNARRRAALLLSLNIAALVADAGVALVGVPLIGLWAAVAANVIGQLTVLLPLAVIECRVWGVSLRSYLSACAPFLAAAGVAGGAVASFRALDLSVWVSSSAGTALGLSAMVAVSRFGTSIDEEDFASLMRPLPNAFRAPVERVARVVLGPATVR